eukprot:GEMP01070535.1.p1 GENE.GEMP01070535.1~~GEMP01070535.1.p1  ORF type:complete len:304 (+),score=64.39 GEMP01070535.1:135-1046(+)
MAKLHRSKRHMQVFIENFGPLCREILFSLIDIFNIVLVDGWVNWYRTGDHKSFHHDNYQDRTPRPTITITLSLGCAQTLKFRDARTMEETDDVLMEHGDLLGFDDDFNRKYQHAVSKKVIPDDRFDSRVSFVVWGLPGSHVVPAVLRSNPQEPVTCVTLWESVGTTLDLSSVTQAFTVQGPQMARAMLLGKKCFENRSWIIPPGWYALHVGAKEEITEDQAARLALTFPDCPPLEELPRSCIMGFVQLGPAVTPDQVESDVWSLGPFCHPIINSCVLPRAVKMSGQQKLWNFEKMNGSLPCMR